MYLARREACPRLVQCRRRQSLHAPSRPRPSQTLVRATSARPDDRLSDRRVPGQHGRRRAAHSLVAGNRAGANQPRRSRSAPGNRQRAECTDAGIGVVTKGAVVRVSAKEQAAPIFDKTDLVFSEFLCRNGNRAFFWGRVPRFTRESRTVAARAEAKHALDPKLG